MELLNAILVFVIENYLRFFSLVVPVCSFIQYYNSAADIYIITLRLILLLTIAVILYASTSLTKMDCTRIANYFLLPVAIGILYLHVTHYYQGQTDGGWDTFQADKQQPDNSNDQQQQQRGNKSIGFYTDLIELYLSTGMAFLVAIQFAANSFEQKLSKILN